VITARRALLSLLELDSKCSELVTTSTPNEFSSVGSGAACYVMASKNKTLQNKPITRRPKYELLYCRVAILACRRFSLSPSWSSYCSVAVLVCRRFDHRPMDRQSVCPCPRTSQRSTSAASLRYDNYVCNVRRSLSQESFTRLVVALVLSRLDYCNRVLAGLPACYLSRLQSVLHAAAQLIHGVSRYDPVTPLLR